MTSNYFTHFFNRKKHHVDKSVEEGSKDAQDNYFLSCCLRLMTYLKGQSVGVLILSAVILALLIICVGLYLIHHDSTRVIMQQDVQAKHTQSIFSQINDIDSQLQALQTNPQNSQGFKDGLVKINADLENIQQSITSMKEDMDTQITDLKKVVNTNPNMKQYLDEKELPFKVISIDVIGEQPFASVNYNDHVTPITIGDALAGWVLEKADYSTATAEFKNEKDQYIKVIIQG